MKLSALRTLLAVVLVVMGLAGSALAQEARYIVKFRAGRSAAGHAALRAAGAQVMLSLDQQDAAAVHIPAAALNGLSRNPHIEYIEDDVIREPFAVSNVALSGSEDPAVRDSDGAGRPDHTVSGGQSQGLHHRFRLFRPA